MYFHHRLRAVFAFFLAMAASVQAHENEPLFNQVHLQVETERDITNDEMQVVMVSEHQGSAPAGLAAKVNSDTSWALQNAKRKKSFEISTRSYQTSPVYRDGGVVAWRVSQEIVLRGTDMAGLSELVGTLQSRLQIRQMHFSASKETRTAVEDELIDEAMQAFEHRLAIVRKHMGDKEYRIVNLHINSNGQPRPLMRASRMGMAAMESADAPSVEAGTSRLVVSVSGSVQFF